MGYAMSRCGAVVVLFNFLAVLPAAEPNRPASSAAGVVPHADRSPVDLVLSADERWVVTANQTSDSLSLVEVESGKVVEEISCGDHPCALALAGDGKRLVVSTTYAGDLEVFSWAPPKLVPLGKVSLGFEPRGVAISPDGQRAYVALTAAAAVAVVDLSSLREIDRIRVGRWPRYLALSPDGLRLAVGANGDRGVSVVDTQAGKMLYQEEFRGINLGQMQIASNGKEVYLPWMVYRQNPITREFIQLGWVLGSRIARVRLDGPAAREAITLDPRGMAVSDPFGLALTPNEQWLVCAASGTQELLVYRLPDLPLQGIGGPGDHIDPKLLGDRNRFYRIPLGGRPMFVRAGGDNRTIYVANYLGNSVQVVDLDERRVIRTLPLGGPAKPALARVGEAIFFDGRRSLDQWYSCHSCHYEGGTNAVTVDTHNDGSIRTFKTVLDLRNVAQTGPWTWHGWQTDLQAAMHKSLTDTMLGPRPTDADARALIAYFDTLRLPPNPNLRADGKLSPAAEQGKIVFHSAKAGCANCHQGDFFTDGQVHDVGLGSPNDKYQGFNTPSLLGVHNRLLLLHHGRAKSLEELLTDLHSPAKVTGQGELTSEELKDLVAYLKSL